MLTCTSILLFLMPAPAWHYRLQEVRKTFVPELAKWHAYRKLLAGACVTPDRNASTALSCRCSPASIRQDLSQLQHRAQSTAATLKQQLFDLSDQKPCLLPVAVWRLGCTELQDRRQQVLERKAKLLEAKVQLSKDAAGKLQDKESCLRGLCETTQKALQELQAEKDALDRQAQALAARLKAARKQVGRFHWNSEQSLEAPA